MNKRTTSHDRSRTTDSQSRVGFDQFFMDLDESPNVVDNSDIDSHYMGLKRVKENHFHEVNNPNGVIQMSLAKKTSYFTLLGDNHIQRHLRKRKWKRKTTSVRKSGCHLLSSLISLMPSAFRKPASVRRSGCHLHG